MASGCFDIIVGQMVQVHPTPVAGFNIQKVNLNTRQFLNQSITVDTAISYYWTFGDGSWSTEQNPTHEYDPNIIGLDSIKICLRVTNSYGCMDSTCTTIWIWPPNLDVPNALAPGLNYVGEDAIFLPKGHSLGQYELEIFDVWGNVVFRTTELDADGKPSEGWDGRDMRTGNPCAMGVYAWRIRAVFDNGERWVGRTDAYGGCSECGTLTLLR
jgi:PKD repeat protein